MYSNFIWQVRHETSGTASGRNFTFGDVDEDAAGAGGEQGESAEAGPEKTLPLVEKRRRVHYGSRRGTATFAATLG